MTKVNAMAHVAIMMLACFAGCGDKKVHWVNLEDDQP